ncbi:MAG: DUF1588 domain-containing protein, partial [Planctomycetales bacterium]
AVNPEHFPKYNDDLESDSAEETYSFFLHVLRNDLSATSFLDSDFVMLNDRMARHYGVEGVSGSQFRPVSSEEVPHRGGLLTQASILTANSNGVESHPIKRGVWLMRQLLNDPPPPPPPNVPLLEEEELAKGLSISELLKEHRNNAACNDCHRKIDPWGVVFENYDAVGAWRTAYGSSSPAKKSAKKSGKQPGKQPSEGKTIDASAALPGDVQVNNLREMQQHLVQAKSEAFAKALVENLLMYSLGRSLEFTDADAVDELTQSFLQDGCRLGPFLERLVPSDVFRTK